MTAAKRDPDATDQRPVPGSARPKEEALQRSVDQAVPDAEQLPGRADDNPISERVHDAAEGKKPRADRSTLQGGNEVEP